jgi:hypothetical protein
MAKKDSKRSQTPPNPDESDTVSSVLANNEYGKDPENAAWLKSVEDRINETNPCSDRYVSDGTDVPQTEERMAEWHIQEQEKREQREREEREEREHREMPVGKKLIKKIFKGKGGR